MARPAAHSTAGPFQPGHVVADRYEVESVLGDGASGVVYVATDREAEERVALKVIHRHLVKDRQIHARFVREAGVLRRLDGEHLVALRDFGQDDEGLLYMALDLVEGEGLDSVVESGPMGVTRAITILRQVCKALEAAHQAGIVHRDLKPGNVLLEASDDLEKARVLDFGMAKVLRGDSAADSITALTEQNMVFGTPEYMAPEQARGDDVDRRTDIYAAGVMLYELVTGTVPFQKGSPITTMTAHLVDEPEPPSRRAPRSKIPPALESVILHALAKVPAERYPDAGALAAALERALDDPADITATVPPPTLDEGRPRTSMEELAHSDTMLDLRAVAPRSQPPAPRKSSDRAWVVAAFVAAIIGIGAGLLFSLLGG